MIIIESTLITYKLLEKIVNLEFKLSEYDRKLDELNSKLRTSKKEEFTHKIFYEGQVFDAYSLVIDIIESAENKIIIIDNYVDKSVLRMLTKKKSGVNVTLITSNNCNLTKVDKDKFNKQYPTLKIDTTKSFHDRFIIIDDKKLYHCGASLKDLGKTCFAITKMEDSNFIEKITI